MERRRLLSMGLAAALCVFCILAASVAAGAMRNGLDVEDYENGEIFVSYVDGSVEVLVCEDDAELTATLEALALDETVEAFQPNCSYQSTALAADDELSAQQWALYNDGSFQMTEQGNAFPVYDEPFGAPSQPGQWTMPGGVRSHAWAGLTAVSQTVTATAGVDIHVQEAWSVYDGGSREVIVALIDTGVDYTHEDLQDAIWVNEGEIAGNGLDDDGNGYVDDVYGWNFYSGNNQIYTSANEDSHGTHGAGTIAASAGNGVGIAGIVNSKNVRIMVLKALGGKDGSGTTASIVKTIQYAEANGASICNLSLGTSQNDRALYQAMKNSSMLFVTAAGNDGKDISSTPCYPASYDLDNIISVASLSCDGTLHASSGYSVQAVDLAAPGAYILSTTPGNSYSYMTGTSMAAPMVTAACAMVYSYYEDATLSEVKDIILDSAMPLSTLTGRTLTGGMLDLGAAMGVESEQVTLESEDQSAASAPSTPEQGAPAGGSRFLGGLPLTTVPPYGDIYMPGQRSNGPSSPFSNQRQGPAVLDLIDRCTCLQLSPQHLLDVVQDFLTQQALDT